MADSKTTALTAATSWASGDLLYLVRDPAGTPVSRKITVDNILQNLVCAANTSLLKSTTGYSLTGSNASSMIDLAGTWNTSGTPSAIKLNITNTASNAMSSLLNLQIGGVDRFIIINTGVFFQYKNATDYTYSAPAGSIYGYLNSLGRTTQLVFDDGSGNGTNSGLHMGANSFIRWHSLNRTDSGVFDLALYRDQANTLALRNAANAQAFRLYGTYTDASNYRRLITTMSTAGVAEIKPDGAGTGASGNVLHISGLPTSNPGPGILWNNSGTPAIGT